MGGRWRVLRLEVPKVPLPEGTWESSPWASPARARGAFDMLVSIYRSLQFLPVLSLFGLFVVVISGFDAFWVAKIVIIIEMLQSLFFIKIKFN